MDQSDQRRHLNQRADNSSKRNSRIKTEDSNGYGNCQFKIIAGCSEGYSNCFGIVCAYLDSHPKANQKHYYKVDQQRDGNAYHVERDGNDEFPLEAEHNNDGKEQCHQGDWTDFRNKLILIPVTSSALQQDKSCNHAREKWYAKIDGDAFSDLGDGDFYNSAL